MTKANIFKSNRTKATRSQDATALLDNLMCENINHQAKKKLIISAISTWADFFAGPRLDDDFLNNRNQPAPQNWKAVRHP